MNYPKEVLIKALEEGVSAGIIIQPEEMELEATLTSLDNLLEVAMSEHIRLVEEESLKRLQPIKVESVQDIPFPIENVLFIDTINQPGKEVCSQIARRGFAWDTICFIGQHPAFAIELTMIGYRVYELPAGITLAAGLNELKPYKHRLGLFWLETIVGEPAIRLC